MRNFLDKDGLNYLLLKLKELFIQKEEGKGLSTNDYTTEEKTKLSRLSNYTHPTGAGYKHIPSGGASGQVLKWSEAGTATWQDEKDTTYSEATITTDGLMSKEDKTKLNGVANGAQVNVIESLKVNGTAQVISGKSVNITVPTNNNQLTNGAGYQTETQVAEAISEAVGKITGFDFSVVTSLPATGKKGTIYLVSKSGSGNDIYDEYIYVNSKFEKIGNTAVDLSGYLKSVDLVAITNEEIDMAMAEG